MKMNYTRVELEKLEQYFRSLGDPIIEWKTYDRAWGHEYQEVCRNNIKNIRLYPDFQYRIENDPHWELREKWVLSDFTLPIEWRSDVPWVTCPNPCWTDVLQYREKPSLGEYIADGMITKGHLYENKGYSASHLIELANTIREERGAEYEKKEKEERSFTAVASAFNAITGKNLSPAEVCLLLQILKDVRQFSQERFHLDSAVDCINYAALKGELLAEQYEVKE